MKQPLAMLVAGIVLTGCQGPAPSYDPFLGRTRVPPPGTGQAMPPAAVPYYQGAPPPGSPQMGTPAPGMAPPPGSYIAPQGGLGRAETIRPSADRNVVQAAAFEAVNEPAIQIPTDSGNLRVQPQQQSRQAIAVATHTEPVEITDLAERTAPSTADASAGPPDAQPNPASSRARGSFGYHTDYGWLQGRLEYLQTTGQWKLRYIPIDGDTDRYGGSVAIANPEVLETYEPGDVVRLEGSIVQEDGDGRSFAPTYRVRQIGPTVD